MRLEYWLITSVYKNELKWAQLCNVKSHISDREYIACEVISSKWQNFLPKVWDLAVISEMHNWEIIVMWVLEPFDLNLSEWEVLFHNGTVTKTGQTSRYNMQARIYVNKDKEIELSTGSSSTGTYISTSNITISKTGQITIKSNLKVSIEAPSIEFI